MTLDPQAAVELLAERSGNRSASAVAEMAQAGFGEGYEAGGSDDLAVAGVPAAP